MEPRKGYGGIWKQEQKRQEHRKIERGDNGCLASYQEYNQLKLTHVEFIYGFMCTHISYSMAIVTEFMDLFISPARCYLLNNVVLKGNI